MDWLTTEPMKAALAGAAGGVVRWITLRDNWREGVPVLIAGALCAVYLSPLVIYWLGLSNSEAQVRDVIPFIVGLGGVGFAGFILDLVKNRLGGGGPDARA